MKGFLLYIASSVVALGAAIVLLATVQQWDGCKPRSHACMKRWLERNHWPFAVNIAGVPLVAREYYDARMNGTAPATPARRHRAAASEEPNFAAL